MFLILLWERISNILLESCRFRFGWQASFIFVSIVSIPLALIILSVTQHQNHRRSVLHPSSSKRKHNTQQEQRRQKLEENHSNMEETTEELATTTISSASNPTIQNAEIMYGQNDANTAPLHLNSIRNRDARLRGSTGMLMNRPPSRSTSRSRSTSPTHAATLLISSFHSIELLKSLEKSSSISSLNDESSHASSMSADILTDRMGFEELEPPSLSQRDSLSLHQSLTPVNERMSEESLDDVHAFSDVTIGRRTSVDATSESIKNNPSSSLILETLNEEEDLSVEEEEEPMKSDIVLTKKKQACQKAFIEILGTVSDSNEREELKKVVSNVETES